MLNKQEVIDHLHTEITKGILEIAYGLGCTNTNDFLTHVKRGRQALTDIAGPVESDRTLDMLVDWALKVSVPESTFTDHKWDLSALDTKTKLASQLSLKQDFLIKTLENKLNYFGGHSKSMLKTAKVVEGTCTGVALFAPGFGVPVAARAVQAGWGKANGGSELSKLLKEIYYQRQMESRSQTLSTETQIALLHYREAMLTRNAALLICAEAVLAQLIGAVGIPQIVEEPVLLHGTFTAQPILSASNSATFQ